MKVVEVERDSEGLYRKLVWLTLLRIAIVTVLLATAAAVVLKSDLANLGLVEQVLYSLIVGTYAASLGYLFVLRKTRTIRDRFAYVQVIGDVVISACLIYLTGGAESIVVFMFPLTVVSGAVILYRRGALVAAALSTAALVAVSVGLNTGLLPAPSPSLAQANMAAPRLAFLLFANTSAIFLTAALASYLAEQVRSTRERLTLREHDYRALELLHENIVRSVTSGIVTTDRHVRITFVNPAAERLIGLPVQETVGEAIDRYLPTLKGRFHENTIVERFQAEHVGSMGTRRWLAFTVAPLLDRLARSAGWVVSFEDLTNVRAMEDAVRRSERLAAIGGMAAGLAHELRNPLASMTGSIQLLAEGKEFSEDDRRLMGIVLREGDRLEGLVTDFLRFARPAPPQLGNVELGDVVASTVSLLRNDPTRRCLSIEEHLEAGLTVFADANQLGQVFWNLLVNAADACSDDGRVVVRANRREDGTVVCSVSDTGVGIPKENLGRIFDPFFTTKERGTGLGLATVHGVVQAHKGEILVDSELGRGTTFTVMLPAHGIQEQSS